MSQVAETLEERYKGSPLLEMYQRKLLIPGWCGAADKVEWLYIASKLREDKRLRGQWKREGFDTGAILRRKHFPTRHPTLQLPLKVKRKRSQQQAVSAEREAL